jgi:hypothetical protein
MSSASGSGLRAAAKSVIASAVITSNVHLQVQALGLGCEGNPPMRGGAAIDIP